MRRADHRAAGLLVGALASAALAIVPAVATAGTRAPSAAGLSLAPAGSSTSLRVATVPGATVTRAVRLENRSDRDRVVRLAISDLDTAATGGIAFPSTAPTATGRWIDPGHADVRVGAHTARTVKLQIRVPGDAGAGQHFAGIVAVDRADARRLATVPTDSARHRVSVRQITRLALPLRVTLPGPETPALTLEGIDPAADASGAGLAVRLRNAGNRIIPSSKLDLRVRQDDRTRFRYRADMLEIVPGTAIAYPVAWRGKLPKGDVQVVGTIRPKGLPPIAVNQTVKFPDAFDKQVERITGTPAGPSTQIPVWVWGALGAALLLAALTITTHVRLRRKLAEATR